MVKFARNVPLLISYFYNMNTSTQSVVKVEKEIVKDAVKVENEIIKDAVSSISSIESFFVLNRNS